MAEVERRKEELEKERLEYYEGFNARKEAAVSAGEVFDEEEREWEVIEQKEFTSVEEKYVVMLDTLGQDRQFTSEQKRFVLNTITRFGWIWEQQEARSLTSDRDAKIASMQLETKQAEQENTVIAMEEIEKVIETHFNEMAAVNPDQNLDDELREIMSREIRLNQIGKCFMENEEWRAQLDAISKMRVLKMPRIIQSLFYLLRFERDALCYKNTNQLDWKIASKKMALLPKAMFEFKVVTECKNEYKAFQTLNFCERVLQAHTEEDVQNYNTGFLKLYRWLKIAIEARKSYIVRTKAQVKRDREDRGRREEQAEERAKQKENHLIEARDKFNDEHREEIQAYEEYEAELAKKEAEEYGEEAGSDNDQEEEKEPPVKPVYNEAEVIEKFDEDFPEIVIPDEVQDVIHNDWVLQEDEEQRLVDDYLAGKTE